jgi:hypothetical protein
MFICSLHKEWLSYGKELERQQGRIQKMKDQQEDEYNIKKQVQCIIMITRRLSK